MENREGNITEKPWGYFCDIKDENGWHIKTITVNPKSRLSLQSHNKRREIWIVIEGDIKTEVDGKTSDHHLGDIITIEVKQKHRLFSTKGGKIIEVSLGEFKEDDIIRYQDDYGRTKN